MQLRSCRLPPPLNVTIQPVSHGLFNTSPFDSHLSRICTFVAENQRGCAAMFRNKGVCSIIIPHAKIFSIAGSPNIHHLPMAELALAVVPLCVTAIQGTAFVRKKLKLLRHHDKEIKRLRKKFITQTIIFLDECQLLLQEILEPGVAAECE